MIKRSKLNPVYMFIIGLASILEGLVSVISLGFYDISLTLPLSIHYAIKSNKKNKK